MSVATDMGCKSTQDCLLDRTGDRGDMPPVRLY